LELKSNLAPVDSVNEPKTEYALKDDFEERWSKGYTCQQSRKETKRRIKEWWGK